MHRRAHFMKIHRFLFAIIASVQICAFTLFSCAQKLPSEQEIKLLFFEGHSRPHKMLNDAIAFQTHVVWSSGNHISNAVPVGSIGPSRFTRLLGGMIKNTDIAHIMHKAVSQGVSVILVIGDGFGISHLSLQSIIDIALKQNRMNAFSYILNRGRAGFCHTYTLSELVTDSAAAATALATGEKTTVGRIGLSVDGKALESIVQKAKRFGLKTGIITDTRITHATPSGFYGHAKSRSDENLIALQLTEANIDVILGGGAEYFIPKHTLASAHPLLKTIALDGKSKRKDRLDLIALMNKKGYRIVAHKNDLLAAYKFSDKTLGLFAADNMNSRIDRDNENTGEPSLPEMANAALFVLSKHKKGFFLMIECGKLDYDSHENDLGATIAALCEMEEVLTTCLHYYHKKPEKTLLIFTGDHETGAPSFSYYATRSIFSFNETKQPSNYSFPNIESIKPFMQQKRSVRSIFSDAKSPEDLMKKIQENISIKIPYGDAKKIFEAIER